DRTHYNRGLIYLRMRDFKRAVADFDRFLKSQPEDVSGYLSRAQAEEGRQEYAKAEADLTRVIELNSDHTQAYLLRSRIKEKRGDRQGAKRDLEEGMRRTPSDEVGWVGRGKHRLDRLEKGKPEETHRSAELNAAIKDFDKALQMNPRYLPALRNKAHTLGKLKRWEAALKVLDLALEFYPDSVETRLGRGIYRARLEQRKAAHEDARQALEQDNKPPTQYFAAGIYALTSRQVPEDRWEAYRLLASALKQGFGYEQLPRDANFDSCRGDRHFDVLLSVARTLQAAAAKKTS